MNIEQLRERLRTRERDLMQDMSNLEGEGRDARLAEVQDPIDEVTADEGKAAAFELDSRRYEELAQIRDALRRMDEGTYGKCIICGRQIEETRLQAVPQTPYCLEDQEKLEREEHPADEGLS